MAEDAGMFVVYRHYTLSGAEYRWRLRSPTGETLAWSPAGHPDRVACENEMQRIKESYPGSTVRDLTL